MTISKGENNMTVGEFKKTIGKDSKKVRYFDLNGKDISNKYPLILDLLTVIGSSHNTDGSIDVDVQYTE